MFRYLAKRLCSAALLAAIFVAASAGNCRADDTDDSPRHQEWVKIPTSTGRSLRTFVVYPEVNKPAHAVILIHENRGLTPWERQLADEIAKAGYIAIAPDLLSEMAPDKGNSDGFESAGAAREAIHNLKPEQVVADLDAVAEYAGNLPAGDKRTFVAGFCWGGGQAFRFAAANSGLAGVMVFYGVAPTDEILKQIQVPVYGFYGENDFRISGEVPKLKSRLKALEKNYQPVVYAGAGHGFMRAGEAADAKPADRKAREEAWTRMQDVLKQP